MVLSWRSQEAPQRGELQWTSWTRDQIETKEQTTTDERTTWSDDQEQGPDAPWDIAYWQPCCSFENKYSNVAVGGKNYSVSNQDTRA